MVGESTGASDRDSMGPKSAAYRLTDHLTPSDCKQFVSRHDGNCFALPIPLLDLIRSQLKDCLSREDYEAERSFGEFCDRHHLLGFWNNAPIFDPYTPFTGKVRTERYADRSVPLRILETLHGSAGVNCFASVMSAGCLLASCSGKSRRVYFQSGIMRSACAVSPVWPSRRLITAQSRQFRELTRRNTL